MSEEKTRFSMVKIRHKKTFEKAVKENKADPQIISLCTFIASTKNYFTSSSCSGRIVLMNLNEEETKKEAAFFKKWHRTVNFEEVNSALQEKTNEEIWFKQEPFILHIGCKDLKYSEKVLELMKKLGIKRGGIMVAKQGKFILELLGTQNISVPIKKENKILVSEEHLKFIVKKANKKLEKNYRLLKEFEKECKKKMK